MLRFAILKSIGEKEQVVIEYDEKQIFERLQSRRREFLTKLHLAKIEKWQEVKMFKGKAPEATFSDEEISRAEKYAFDSVIAEFKKKTISLI